MDLLSIAAQPFTTVLLRHHRIASHRAESAVLARDPAQPATSRNPKPTPDLVEFGPG
jgi:hypothetical protein